MSFVDDIKPTLHAIRAIPGQFGLREHSVTIVIKSYTGSVTGEGTEIALETPIVESGGYAPKVRWLRDDEIAVGDLDHGAIEVGPITSEFSTGGLDLTELNGSGMAVGETRYLRITGPKHPDPGALYVIKEIRADRAMHRKIRAVPVSAAE